MQHTSADELSPVFMVTTTWAWLLALASAVVSAGAADLLGPAVAWAGAIIFVLAGSSTARALSMNRAWYRQPVVVIGDGDEIERILGRILRHPEWGLDPVATIKAVDSEAVLDHLDDGRVKRSEPLDSGGDGRPSVGTLAATVDSLDVTRAIVTAAARTLSERTELIRTLAEAGVCVDYVSGEPETLYSTAVLNHLEGLPVLSVRLTSLGRGAAMAKRGMDVAVAGVGLLVLSPVFACAALGIKLGSRGPVLFRQPRVGRDGKQFEMLKFRTMVTGADQMRDQVRARSIHGANGNLLKIRDDPRVTRVGRWLRRSSLDELPQLWNVLRGEMSLVGPRPLPLDEAPMVTDHFRARLRMRPGMTGPWQTQGRSDIPFEDMVKLDYTYVVGWSMREDLSLLLRTVTAVVRGRGAY